VLFNVAEPSFEQALISFDIQFMIPQTGNSVGHSRHPALKMFLKKVPFILYGCYLTAHMGIVAQGFFGSKKAVDKLWITGGCERYGLIR
jgi:hypothetical protein